MTWTIFLYLVCLLTIVLIGIDGLVKRICECKVKCAQMKYTADYLASKPSKDVDAFLKTINCMHVDDLK